MGRVRRDRRTSQADASVHALKELMEPKTSAIDNIKAQVGQYVPPSTTVIHTQSGGWYYIPDSFEDTLELIDTAEEWIVFPVVGSEVTKVMLRKSDIAAVTDLTQPEPIVDEAAIDKVARGIVALSSSAHGTSRLGDING